jgi:hypothetical protein
MKKKNKGDTFIPTPTKSERDWRAIDDARTLANAIEITADKKRFNAANKEAIRLAAEKQKEANAMMAVSNKKKK